MCAYLGSASEAWAISMLNLSWFTPGRGRLLLQLLVIGVAIVSCGRDAPQKTQIVFVASETTVEIPAGTSELGLGERLFINRSFAWRDGLLHVPPILAGNRPAPMLIWLHGGGGHARDAKKLFPFADEFGVVVLALDSRHNTWDGIDAPFGPDVHYIERSMKHVSEKVSIDPDRIALGGASDGGTYALALGRSNGRVFSHIIAVSPWRLDPPAPVQGDPRIFVAHGLQDDVYPEWHSRRFLVPSLRDDGYDVTYFPHDGPHWVTSVSARALMNWFVEDSWQEAKGNLASCSADNPPQPSSGLECVPKG